MWQERRIDALALGLALCAVPLSIAITEIILGVALCARLIAIVRGNARIYLPRVFWYWLTWAGLEIASWLCSPEIRLGWGEIRHLLLIAALFLMLPSLDKLEYRMAVWRGIFLTATIGAISVIISFVIRMVRYQHEISIAPVPSLYLRTGGLLNHWMIFATVELLVFAALLEFSHFYPEQRRFTWPMMAIHCAAVIVSLTRILWLCCLLLFAIELLLRRSKWIFALPLAPVALYLLAPGAVRSRFTESFQPNFYSNAERVQMIRVGWQMIREHPFTGVGPGRVEKLYLHYLTAQDPVPAYHGHLHNDAVHLAAQFGLPVLAAAVLFLAMLTRDLIRKLRRATDRQAKFLCWSSLLGLASFLCAGMADYNYGHSLGLILLSFVALSPLMPDETLDEDYTRAQTR